MSVLEGGPFSDKRGWKKEGDIHMIYPFDSKYT